MASDLETAEYQRQIKELNDKLKGYEKDKTNVASYMDPANKGKVTLTGSQKEKESQLSGLNLAKLGYGQGLEGTGEDISRIRGQLRDRSNLSGSDPVTAAIMGQKASAMAGAQRSMQSAGVKGGVAAGAADAIGRQRDADIAASLYGQQRQSLADERSLASNTLSGTIALMQGEKGQATAGQMPSAPSGGGTSFICTMLRSKKLMNGKETLIMTQFMLKSMIQRSDFLVWYFKHGKKAVDMAESEGFDWGSIKSLFVDEIIDLLKQGKMREAQNLYIERTGTFCSHYGAKEFNYKLAVYRPLAVINFPRLFFIENCMGWLKANFRNIPKILTAKVV